jgi:hypothetical protein
MVYLIPLVILTFVVDLFKITIGGNLFYAAALILFVGYFVQDLYLLTSERFTFTVAVMLAIIQLVTLAAKVINGSIQLSTVDEETPHKIRRSVFPLNCV